MKRLLTLLALTLLLAGCSNMPAPDGKVPHQSASASAARK
jgi:PBP1b-binding outer membrane lipoprotein LpoB